MERYAHPGVTSFIAEAVEAQGIEDPGERARIADEIARMPAIRAIDVMLGQATDRPDDVARSLVAEADRQLKRLPIAHEAGTRALAEFIRARGFPPRLSADAGAGDEPEGPHADLLGPPAGPEATEATDPEDGERSSRRHRRR